MKNNTQILRIYMSHKNISVLYHVLLSTDCYRVY